MWSLIDNRLIRNRTKQTGRVRPTNYHYKNRNGELRTGAERSRAAVIAQIACSRRASRSFAQCGMAGESCHFRGNHRLAGNQLIIN
ncbi:hypothetical protein J6590_013444 [Homalodisca vitripennis]|nr:hypothetical protein J6590_013444 [Homalodisca vitripennis]